MPMIYLYVKRHSITGLKYFGKTYYKNPYKYNGSGTYWKSHIKKHGRQYVETLNVWEFECPEECSKFATNFSIENNIAASDEWANLILENGKDGTPPGRTFTYEHRQKLSESHKGFKHHPDSIERMKGRVLSEETRNKLSAAARGRSHDEETKLKISTSNKGKPKSTATCSICGLTTSVNNISRWHNERCKHA